MRVYLIDSDNISIKQLVSEAHLLRDDDKLIIFYDDIRSENLKLKDYSILTNSGNRQVKFIEAYGGTENALDFQLSSYMGFMIHETLSTEKTKDSTEFIILTKDNGFKTLFKFWASYGIRIKTREHFAGVEKDCGSLEDIKLEAPLKPTETDNIESAEKVDDTEHQLPANDTASVDTNNRYSDKQFGKILDKEKYNPKENGYHMCYLEKELSAIKRAREKNPKNGIAEAIRVIRSVKMLDAEQIRFNSNHLKNVVALDSGESYDVIAYIIYYSPTFEVMKANLYDWFVSLQTKKIKLIVENLGDFMNVDVDRFEK